MKKLFLFSYVLSVVFLLSCGRDTTPKATETENIPTSTQVESTKQANDNRRVENSIDKSVDDAVSQLQSVKGGRLENCGFNTVTISGQPNRIELQFTGEDCALVGSRTGKIILELVSGTGFWQKDAVWRITYDAYAVTQGNSTVRLDGTHTLQNLTGGRPAQVALANITNVTLVSYLVTSQDMRITFDNETVTRTWNVARKFNWTRTEAGRLQCVIEGAGTADGFDNLVTWGINRDAKPFYTQIVEPIVLVPLECGFNRPTAGQRLHTLLSGSTTDYTVRETLRYNAQGCANALVLNIIKGSKEREIVVNF